MNAKQSDKIVKLKLGKNSKQQTIKYQVIYNNLICHQFKFKLKAQKNSFQKAEPTQQQLNTSIKSIKISPTTPSG